MHFSLALGESCLLRITHWQWWEHVDCMWKNDMTEGKYDSMATWAQRSMINLHIAVLSDPLYHIPAPKHTLSELVGKGGCQSDKPYLWSVLMSETYLLKTVEEKTLSIFSSCVCVCLCLCYTTAEPQNKGESAAHMQSHTALTCLPVTLTKREMCFHVFLLNCLHASDIVVTSRQWRWAVNETWSDACTKWNMY